MKKSILVLTIALAGAISPLASFAADPPAATPAAPAGGGRGQRMNPDDQLKAMKDLLSLTDDQSTKILAILKGQQDKMKALRDDTSLSQEDRRAKMREIRTGQQDEINKILTADQQTKWKAEMEKRRAARGNGGNGN
jgi:Spy/CpxP family protein refolding chaperone